MEHMEVNLHGYKMDNLERECAKMSEEMKECGILEGDENCRWLITYSHRGSVLALLTIASVAAFEKEQEFHGVCGYLCEVGYTTKADPQHIADMIATRLREIKDESGMDLPEYCEYVMAIRKERYYASQHIEPDVILSTILHPEEKEK